MFYEASRVNTLKINKKIVFVVRNINNGGISKMVSYYANIAHEIFDEVYIVVIGDELNSKLIDHNKIKSVVLGCNNSRTIKAFSVAKDVVVLRRVISGINPDIVFPFGSGNVIYTYLAIRKKYFIVGAERGNPDALKTIIKKLCIYIYKKVDYMVFQSSGVADFYGFTPDIGCSIIPNPSVIPERYCDKRHVRNWDKIARIVTISRLAREKNIDIVIKAIGKCRSKKRIELEIYGDGPEEERLKTLVCSENGSSQIVFMGSTEDPMGVLLNSDIFVLVSNDEGMPNALIEAMSMGVPSISTLCMTNDTNSLINDGVNGLIVKKRNVYELSNAIDELVEDKMLYESISNNSFEIRERLSNDKVINLIKNMYWHIINLQAIKK